MTRPCLDRAVLDEFVAGELTPADREDIARHVETCPACQAAIAQLRSNHDLEARVRTAVLGADNAGAFAAAPIDPQAQLERRIGEDRRFGQALVHAAVLSQSAVDEAAAAQQDALAAGKFERLSDLLVRAGSISLREAERAFQQIDAPYRYCRNCQQRLLILDAYPGKRVRCPHCAAEITL